MNRPAMDEGALWSSLPLPGLLIAPDDRIETINAAAEVFLNLSDRAVRGQNLWGRLQIGGDLAPAFARARAQNSALFVNHVEVGSSERAPVPCNLQFAPLTGRPGHMILMIAPRDLVNRMSRSPKGARAGISAIGMAEMLAHEIKNPLAGITGAAQLLSMGLAGPDLELTDLIVAESRRIVKLLEQVEQFGNLRPPRRQAVNLHDVLERARTSARLGFGAHMQIVEEYDPSLPPAHADPDQLLQVLLNLIRNASEAGQPGGIIRLRSFYDGALRLRREDGTWASLPLQVEVSDDGPGIPPDLTEAIFEPFVSGRENGTGLGLALVARMIGDLGGWITVESRPGRTAFRISLPRLPEGGAPVFDHIPPDPAPEG